MTQLTLHQLIEQMQQPEFYSYPVQSPIQVIQTHASVIFLEEKIR